MDALVDDDTTNHCQRHGDAGALESHLVKWHVSVGDDVEVGTLLCRCALPRLSPGLAGTGAPGVEVRSGHKGEVVALLRAEGEIISGR